VIASIASGTRVTSWLYFENKINKCLLRIAFDIVFGVNNCLQISGILIANVALIWTWMYRNSFGTKFEMVATFNKLGTFPPRAFRKVAILLMFTLNFVMNTLLILKLVLLGTKYKVKLEILLILIILHEIFKLIYDRNYRVYNQ
jgi:hypothetical protein